ncbi:zinc ribbon domain-containing protein [Nitrospira sp. Kam-Ns4a]
MGWQEPDFQNEAYSSKDCPCCGWRNNPTGRNYSCTSGFKAHRDVVGQVNILRKYCGVRSSHVIGAMASPIGIRWKPHLRCSSKLVGTHHAV